ncbi:hypothetical protein MNV49_001631 [Pseudohyphozyma bogoriensis]|nr:hypothetical protein MNV49_001631 [Pseudohyphozyma bogoriensis]
MSAAPRPVPTPLPLALAPASRRRSGITILDVPASVLDRIVTYSLQSPPRWFNSTTILLVCQQFYHSGLRVAFKRVDTSPLPALACRHFALLLDANFDERLNQFVLHFSQGTLPHRPATTSHLYPITPANLFPSAGGPPFRHHLTNFRLASRWDVSTPLSPVWGGRGFPLLTIPLVLDIIRLRLPALRHLWVDLPKSLLTLATQQALADQAGFEILRSIARFHSLDALTIDVWNLDDTTIKPILLECISVTILSLRRVHITRQTFLPPSSHPSFGLHLQRLTITDATVDLLAIITILKTCLSLQSLQLLGIFCDDQVHPPVHAFVGLCDPSHQRFSDRPHIAPLRSLVLRLSYRMTKAPHHVPVMASLLLALSSTLQNLHLSIQLADAGVFLLLLSQQLCPRLEKVWIGFITANEELGGRARLTVADDRRLRAGLVRGDEYLEGADPLSDGPKDQDGLYPELTPQQVAEAARSGSLVSERVVLGRLGVDENLVRALVDPSFTLTWPPTRLNVYGKVMVALNTFPTLQHSLNIQRPTRLMELHIFETEYVGARVMMGNHGFNS